MALVIDIETIRRELSEEEVANIRASIKPDSRMKDPVKIEADIDKKFGIKMDKLALDPFYNQIVAISARYHGAGTAVRFDKCTDREDNLISEFVAWVAQLKDAKHEIYPFVGVNIIGFDLPTIALHIAKFGIDPLGIDLMPSKYNRKRVIDLMTLFDGNWKSTDALADYFGIDTSDNPITGADVQECWDDGSHDLIARHCKEDVDTTWEIWHRVHKLVEVR